MPRVHRVEKARKAYPGTGIEKGDTYYYWTFRYGGKRRSKTYPRASELTQSAFLSEVYSIGEEMADFSGMDGDSKESFEEWREDLRSAVEDWASRFRDAGEECQSNRDNMPEGLQEGDVGTMLEERADRCEEIASELECVDLDQEPDDPDEGGAYSDLADSILEEVRGNEYDGE